MGKKSSASQARWNASEHGKAAKRRWVEKNPKYVWSMRVTHAAQHRADKAGLPFDITPAYVLGIAPDKCPVFGTPFVFVGNKRIGPNSPSLDRLRPEAGYVPGNIEIISVRANVIKSAYTSTEVAAVARWMAEKGL